MALAFVVVAAVLAYAAGGLALWMGTGWLFALLVVSGVGSTSLLMLVLLALGLDTSRKSPDATPSTAPATDPVH